MNKKISKKTTCFFFVLFALLLALLLASCDCTHEWGEWETVTAATCGSEGAKQRICVKCEESETNTISATGAHTFGEWEILNTPTYDLDGLKQRSCNCGASESMLLPCVGILRTEHFEVTVPMMSYMIYTNYQEWVSCYQSTGYMQFIKGEGGDGLNTSLPLREQNYSKKTDTATGVTTIVTWFDYFADQAAASVEQILVLCEQANSLGITLVDEEISEIDNFMQTLDLFAAYSGYTTEEYLCVMYGKDVCKKDVRAMLELITLAEKTVQYKMDNLEQGISEERLAEYYESHKADLDIYVDFISYTFVTEFIPVAETEIDADIKNEELYNKYQTDKQKYESRIQALERCTTAKEFCDLLIEYLKEDGATDLEAVNKQSEAHHYNYQKDSKHFDFEDRLFDTQNPVNANDIFTIKNTDREPREEKEVDDNRVKYTYNSANASYTVCFVLKPVHRDEAYLKNVGHILFKTETFKNLNHTLYLTGKTKELAQSLLDEGQIISAENMAKALIELMIQEGDLIASTTEDGEAYYYMDKHIFEAYGEEYTEDSNVFYENVKRGDMVAAFDEWIYDINRISNEVSLIKTSYGYHIMFYDGETEQINWVEKAITPIINADYENWYAMAKESTFIDSNYYKENINLIS
ncbi:MAG: hypothetical protein IKB41_02410 [Clostridia bacterium]|nr:hypothetical protein [Clostridia bacterium]